MASDSKGSRLIEGLIIAAIILLAVLIASTIYYHDLPSTSSNTVAERSWQTYCDNPNGCFTYPSSWKLNDQDPNNVQVFSPSNQVVISYSPTTGAAGDAADSEKATYQVISIDNLAKPNANLRVVGGIFADDIPAYNVLGNSFITQNDVAVGRDSEVSSLLSYQTPGGSTGVLSLSPNAVTYSHNQALSWFSNSEVQIGKQILESFYFKD